MSDRRNLEDGDAETAVRPFNEPSCAPTGWLATTKLIADNNNCERARAPRRESENNISGGAGKRYMRASENNRPAAVVLLARDCNHLILARRRRSAPTTSGILPSIAGRLRRKHSAGEFPSSASAAGNKRARKTRHGGARHGRQRRAAAAIDIEASRLSTCRSQSAIDEIDETENARKKTIRGLPISRTCCCCCCCCAGRRISIRSHVCSR